MSCTIAWYFALFSEPTRRISTACRMVMKPAKGSIIIVQKTGAGTSQNLMGITKQQPIITTLLDQYTKLQTLRGYRSKSCGMSGMKNGVSTIAGIITEARAPICDTPKTAIMKGSEITIVLPMLLKNTSISRNLITRLLVARDWKVRSSCRHSSIRVMLLVALLSLSLFDIVSGKKQISSSSAAVFMPTIDIHTIVKSVNSAYWM
mmetsp:Transcript_109917/g.311003  ORF Transcript_109917/g.311003 Transcript_109917/m.311003 type:complete len:205 (+) Transcript_109917:358-972(+)